MIRTKQTYAEVNGKKIFNWNIFLNKAVKNKPDRDEWIKAKELACSWVTCACGTQCSIIPRDELGKPEDEVLCRLGFDFYNDIKYGYFISAKEILKEIEKTSARIIKEMTKK